MHLAIKTLLILFLLSPARSEDELTIEDFKKNYFKIITANKGFYEVKAGFENVKDEIVIGNGFINKDLYVDIITVHKNRKVGYFYIFDVDNSNFKMAMQTPKIAENERILSIQLTQIRPLNGFPDVVITTTEKLAKGIQTTQRGYSINNSNPSSFDYKLDEIAEYHSVNEDPSAEETHEPFSFQLFEGDKAVTYWLFMNNGKRIL